mmetsp:Transcript_8780/g.25087  ORF Transcript_8780/g.25087 Transcript_8780/m.25087 type:complete len:385 (-) Transcript_8780:841-1995(-)
MGLDRPHDHADRRRLARAVRAQQPEDLARRHGERQVLHRLHGLGAESLRRVDLPQLEGAEAGPRALQVRGPVFILREAVRHRRPDGPDLGRQPVRDALRDAPPRRRRLWWKRRLRLHDLHLRAVSRRLRGVADQEGEGPPALSHDVGIQIRPPPPGKLGLLEGQRPRGHAVDGVGDGAEHQHVQEQHEERRPHRRPDDVHRAWRRRLRPAAGHGLDPPVRVAQERLAEARPAHRQEPDLGRVQHRHEQGPRGRRQRAEPRVRRLELEEVEINLLQRRRALPRDEHAPEEHPDHERHHQGRHEERDADHREPRQRHHGLAEGVAAGVAEGDDGQRRENQHEDDPLVLDPELPLRVVLVEVLGSRVGLARDAPALQRDERDDDAHK